MTLWLGRSDTPIVILNSALLHDLEAALGEVEQGPAPKGVLLRSRSERVFIAGADLNEIGSFDDRALDEYLALGQRVFNRIEELPCVTVACINGDALGGGLEIALACQYRVAALPAKRVYQIGLPEARLGIMPGWGGTQRLPALLPPSAALGHMTTGRTFKPTTALRLGLIDALVPTDRLVSAAHDLIGADPQPQRPRTIGQRSEAIRESLKWARAIDTHPTRRLPAAKRVLDAVEIGLKEGLDGGLAAERRFLIELRGTEESKGLLSAFFDRGGALKAAQKALREAPAPSDRVAILGDSPLAQMLAARLGKAHQVARIDDATKSSDAQVFIEAAGDDRVAQIAALRLLSAIAADEAIILTTSPILSMTEIAASATNPQRIVGLVPGRPTGNVACEIVRGDETSDAAVGAALAVCKSLGLVPIVQREGGPTVLTRLFGHIALHAWQLAKQTGQPAMVDRLARAEGVAVGPLAVLDRMGLRTAAALVGRLDQIGDVERIYTDPGSTQADPRFMQVCGSAELDRENARGYFVRGLVEAAAEILTGNRVDGVESIRLAAVFGLGLGPWRRDWLVALKRAGTTDEHGLRLAIPKPQSPNPR